MQAVVRCVCESAIRLGFRRIFILNGHGGNIDTMPMTNTGMSAMAVAPAAANTVQRGRDAERRCSRGMFLSLRLRLAGAFSMPIRSMFRCNS